MPTAQVIQDQLEILRKVYQRDIDRGSLVTIAATWANDLNGMDDVTFCAAMERHRQNSPYWPTPAHIKAAAAELKPNRPPVYDGPQALPAGRVDAGQATAVILQRLKGKMTYEQAQGFFRRDGSGQDMQGVQ